MDYDFLPEFADPFLLIVGGVHGAGKTTLCQQLQQRLPLPYLSPQQLAAEVETELRRGELFKLLHQRAILHLTREQSFYLEHVMSGHYLDRLLEQVPDDAFSIHLIYLHLDSAEQAAQRVAARVARDGHPVEREDIESRLVESRRQFWGTYRHRADSWWLVDTAETPVLVAMGERDAIVQVVREKSFHTFLSCVEC